MDSLSGLVGFAVGAIMMLFFIATVIDDGKISAYQKQKNQCEKSLPRDKVCIMKFEIAK